VSDLERHRVFGADCFVGDLEDAAAAVVDRALSGEGGYAVLGNTHVLMESQHNDALFEAVEHAWTVFPDGAPVAWFQRRGGADHARRIPGPDLMPAVLARGSEVGLKHFLFGSTQTVITQLESRLRDQFPGLEIVGAAAPSPGTEYSRTALKSIRRACPDVIWVALGAPRQELWMRRYAATLAPAVVLGVGAAFDFIAGTKKRAPRTLQHMGLEWLHRLASEPRRLGPRYLKTNTQLVLRTGLACLAHLGFPDWRGLA
jgi:N-acetylglucosaminyldiphosphoundecaprenol N-acetyl-beta-D-mannosaminyltransferase